MRGEERRGRLRGTATRGGEGGRGRLERALEGAHPPYPCVSPEMRPSPPAHLPSPAGLSRRSGPSRPPLRRGSLPSTFRVPRGGRGGQSIARLPPAGSPLLRARRDAPVLGNRLQTEEENNNNNNNNNNNKDNDTRAAPARGSPPPARAPPGPGRAGPWGTAAPAGVWVHTGCPRRGLGPAGAGRLSTPRLTPGRRPGRPAETPVGPYTRGVRTPGRAHASTPTRAHTPQACLYTHARACAFTRTRCPSPQSAYAHTQGRTHR